jgi:anthranilate phosphoribosyltransferase
MAEALRRLGAVHAMVVHAASGMDEFSPHGTTTIWEVRDDHVREWQFDPAPTGLAVQSLEGLEGGEPADNAARVRQLLESPSSAAAALRAAVLLNAAAAIHVGGLADSIGEAVELATTSLESGEALAKLEALRRARSA